MDVEKEQELFDQEVIDVKKWWEDSRWRYTKRAFTADQIVAKRGNLKIEYASNTQSKKLWSILEERFKVALFFLNVITPFGFLAETENRTEMLAIRTDALSQRC